VSLADEILTHRFRPLGQVLDLGEKIEWRRDAVNRPLLTGSSGALVRAGAWLTGPLPLALRLIPGLRLAAAVSMTTGSLVTRFGWMAAGRRSATMPAPQES